MGQAWCAPCEGRWPPVVVIPTGNWVAPPGVFEATPERNCRSPRDRRVEWRVGEPTSVTRANVEHASKRPMWTRLCTIRLGRPTTAMNGYGRNRPSRKRPESIGRDVHFPHLSLNFPSATQRAFRGQNSLRSGMLNAWRSVAMPAFLFPPRSTSRFGFEWELVLALVPVLWVIGQDPALI